MNPMYFKISLNFNLLKFKIFSSYQFFTNNLTNYYICSIWRFNHLEYYITCILYWPTLKLLTVVKISIPYRPELGDVRQTWRQHLPKSPNHFVQILALHN